MPSASNRSVIFPRLIPAWLSGLNLLERRLVESHTTVIIPFDDRVIFVSLLNCAELSSRQPSTRSPGFSSWSVAEGSASGGLLARSESGVAPGYSKGGWGALRSLGLLLVGDTGHIPLVPSLS